MQRSNKATRTNRISLFEEDDGPIAYAGPGRHHPPTGIAVPGPELPDKGLQFSSQNNTISATENAIPVQENYMTPALETAKIKLWLNAGDGPVLEEKYVAPDPLAVLAYLLLKNYSDLLRKAYYASPRQNFYNLKHSPNPVVRVLYKQNMAAAQHVRAKTSRQRSAGVSRSGRDVKVLRNGWRQAFSISHWIFSVSRKVAHLDAGAILHIECDLLDPATRHPHCYAMNSEAGDPACRLGIRVTGTDAQGDGIDIWVQSAGTREVPKMNTFVDMLEGLNIQEPEDRERRWIPPAGATGKKAAYTSDVVRLFS
ncbi:uncharacterized protein DFL_000720 [Arthrobotrys flagrans]|uniref:Uncharacterized protein n=1 Tax=Arthrobotrys flagrans TaxID=97331 RepID=A0A437AEK2_ARTFL|nr:hypothetical protein DFL_000720 [Arthrobotrys flagrans]